MTATIRAAIVDDDSIVRSAVTSYLATADDIEIVATGQDGTEAVDLVKRHHIDVLVMDIRMPNLNGIDATRRICQDPACTGVRTIILTTFDLDEHVYGALAAGASGFLVKDASPEDIVRAIRVVAGGEALLAPAITARLIREFARRAPVARDDRDRLAGLTDREREVLVLVGRGLSNAEIATRLTLSHATVKTHVSRILTKLDSRDRAQLVVLAYETGVIVPGS